MFSGGSKKDQQAQITKLIAQNEALSSHLAFLEAHCTLAVSEIWDLKLWINTWDAKAKKKRKLNVFARCLNLEEGLEACDRRDEENRQKVAKKVETAAHKLAKEQERVQARMEQGLIKAYTGTLSMKNKPNLQDIAEALAISKDGTKTNLQNCINSHFDAHPRFKEDLKYMGLFVHRSQKRPAWAISNNQNSPPDETNGPPSNRPIMILNPAPQHWQHLNHFHKISQTWHHNMTIYLLLLIQAITFI